MKRMMKDNKSHTLHRHRLLTLLLVLCPLGAFAQKLIVENITIDVGRTGYEQPVTAVFECRNKGFRKLRISAVRPDCNCTKVEYPVAEIGAGDRFQIRMTYDARQLGHFDKQAAVVSNGTKAPLYIRMHGVVLADLQDFSESYPVEMGDLRLDKSDLEFDDVNRGDLPVQELRLYNTSNRICQPGLMHLPSYLTATVLPERVYPGRTATIKVTLNSSKLHDYGLTQSSVYLSAMPGDKVSSDHEIPVSVVLLPSFLGMKDAQKQYAPHLELSKDQVDVDFRGKTKKSETILISNTGRTDLNISSLQLFTGGLTVSLDKRVLHAGESAKLKVTAQRDELKKIRTRPRILMITNDPDRAKIVIGINVK